MMTWGRSAIRPWRQVLTGAFIFTASLLLVPGGFAADEKGQFAVRGAGLVTCSVYGQEREAQSEAYLVIAAWMDGYITATNQYSPATYDSLSFETTELLAAVISEHCKKNPDERIFPVLKNLLEKLHYDRLGSLSKKTEVVLHERNVSLYVEVLKRVQQQLANLGFYKGGIDGEFGSTTANAISSFQKSIAFDPTGFPDQMTLWRLMRSPE